MIPGMTLSTPGGRRNMNFRDQLCIRVGVGRAVVAPHMAFEPDMRRCRGWCRLSGVCLTQCGLPGTVAPKCRLREGRSAVASGYGTQFRQTRTSRDLLLQAGVPSAGVPTAAAHHAPAAGTLGLGLVCKVRVAQPSPGRHARVDSACAVSDGIPLSTRLRMQPPQTGFRESR